MFFKIAQVYLCLANGTVYKGHLQNKFMSDRKLSGNIQKVANLSILLESSLQLMLIYTLSLEIPRYLGIRCIDFCETSQNGRQSPKVSYM